MIFMKRLVSFLALAAAILTSCKSSECFEHPWKGATVAYLGDSITDPGSVPDAHDWVGKEDWHYWGCLQQWLGIKPYVYGVSGQKWCDVVPQAQQLQAEHGSDFDAITIFMGTNDYIADVPLGQWYDVAQDTMTSAMGYPPTKSVMPRRTPAMNPETLRGRINIAISTLKAMYPDKQIVVLTPLHRGFSTFSEQNIQPDESFPNRIGLYITDYVDVIKEAGNVWGVPVIDLNAVSGLNPMVPEQIRYFGNPDTDQLHPNAEGHRRLALTLMYQLLTLPCRL